MRVDRGECSRNEFWDPPILEVRDVECRGRINYSSVGSQKTREERSRKEEVMSWVKYCF